MRAKLEQLTNTLQNQSFHCYEVNVPSFRFLWHYHPEYELTYIMQGKGKRLVGDSYQSFAEGDLVFLGPQLPHTWVSESVKGQQCRAIVVQFSTAFIEPLLQYKEMQPIEKLLSKANKGLLFNDCKHHEAVVLLKELAKTQSIDALVLLLQLLHKLATGQPTPLSSVHFKALKGNENQQRINQVFLYVQQHFHTTISLQKAASLIHLSQSAFCKFFKRLSGKTFSAYINDIRIAHAIQALIETDRPIAQIAYESGFESLTYFNRVFLKIKGVRPGEVRRCVK